MSSPTTLLSDWLMWALGGLAAVLTPLGGFVKKNRDRSMQNQRQLQGDPSDPNAEGVLQIARDTQVRVGKLEEKLDRARRERKDEHEAVMDRINEIDPDNE